MKDVPLGTLIFRAGLLAEEQLEDALQEGMRKGKRLGEVLLERGWLHERDLGRLLAGQKGLPFVELSGVTADPTAVPLIPEEKARLQSALAIAFEKGVPVVAVADPTNDLVMENLRRVLGCEPRLVVAAHGDLQRKIGEAYAPVEVAPETPPAAPAVEPPAAETAAAEQVPAPAPPPVEPEPPAAALPQPVVEPMPVAQPPVEPAQAPAEPPPLVAQPLVQPVAEQPQQPAPAPAPALQPEPVSAEPAPLVAETPPPVVQPLSSAPPLASEVVAASPPVEVSVPVAEAAREVTPIEAQPPAAEQPPAPEAPVLEQAAVPEWPEPAPSPAEPVAEPSANGSAAESAATHYVILRLSEGEQLEIGSLGSLEEAQGFAQEVVRQIGAAEGDSTWPFFAGRFLRPSGIVSVDIVEGASERWMGSSIRARTFGE